MGRRRCRCRHRSAAGAALSSSEGDTEKRKQILLAAKGAAFLDHKNRRFWHGRLYSGPDQLPDMTWECNKPPRDDHKCPEWLKASEYQDCPDVLKAKCEQLAELICSSKKTVLYTGAGISASVVGQAARGGAFEQGWKEGGGRYANPTLTHFLLGHLGRAGLIHEWVQQNHDGLPQKAGFPQEMINEVHGSWYDPSNPVVKYGGDLRQSEAVWMRNAANTADLVIVLGTSLGGLNADQVATNAANRSGQGRSIGTVIINLQQTPQDGKSSLRIFGTSDDVLRQVCSCLNEDPAINLPLESGQRLSISPQVSEASVRVLVPYDADGNRVEGNVPWMWLDLNTGKEIRITDDNNLQGCQQPAYKHLGATKPIYNVERQDLIFAPGDMGMDIRKNGLVTKVRDGPAQRMGVKSDWIVRKIIDGGVKKEFSAELLRQLALNGTAEYTAVFDVPRYPAPLSGTVLKRDDEACCFTLQIGETHLHLGIWWLEAAARGALKSLPVVNVHPDFAPVSMPENLMQMDTVD